MNKKILLVLSANAWLVLGAFAQQPAGTMAFTVSMEQPSNHLYHVVFHCDGLKGATQDFKMPAWTTGYYVIQNFAQNVSNFHAEDGAGKALDFEKAATNDWRVSTGGAMAVTVSYDVLATRSFVGSCYLDENKGYITPAGLLMHVAGQIKHPATLTIVPNTNWSTIATGLDPVSAKQPHTYKAPDFDVLYDSPILMGNLETFPGFKIKGVPHNFVAYNPGITNAAEFMKNLKAVLSAGIAIMDDIPYTHYTFLAIGPGGGGGIEHLNTASVSFGGATPTNRAGMERELTFLAHEYFHNFNVKRIRPIELGPFDYDRENRTHMLWVSEGITSYYEYPMLMRSGIMTQDEALDGFRKFIANYENTPGRLFQSVAQSSWDTWSSGSFGGGRRGGGAGIRKTISYYDKGPVLGLMLDFKIRHETKNKKSLDTVMRTLYQEYYKDRQRGWTEDEFRAVCEKTAGVPLDEFFTYVYTTKEPDYDKYLAYAGLEVAKPRELSAADLGAIVEDKGGKLVVSALEPGSAAERAKLAAQDEITAADGRTVDAQGLGGAVAAKKPGDTLELTVMRAGTEHTITATLTHKLERSWIIKLVEKPDALQAAILKDWTGGRK